MSKLLILGASILQLPAIKRAKELGHYVAVADYNPSAIGISYADHFFNASTIDIDAICEIAKAFKPNGIITIASDSPMRAVAAATTKLGLRGISPETAIKATDKGEMIKAFKAYQVASPWYYVIGNATGLDKLEITYPCITKPTDNAGSRGVCFVDNRKELDTAFAYSKKESRHGTVIIEEYLTGQEVSVEVMVVDGVSHILAVTDKITTGAPHFVEMGHSEQSQLPHETIKEIKALAIKAIEAVDIQFGPVHVEIMATPNGAKMIELGARMGGDYITTHLVPLSTGIDMIKATIDVSLGLKPDITPKFDKGSAIRYFDVPSGIIKSIKGVDDALKIEGVKEITFTKNIGDKVTSINSSIDRVGYVISQGKDVSNAIQICKDVIKTLNIKIGYL